MLKHAHLKIAFWMFLLAFGAITNSKAQNIYPYKLSNCVFGSFCLDCGDEKANYNVEKFDSLINLINTDSKLNYIERQTYFQVLIDSLGKGCVLSHTEMKNDQLTKSLVSKFNSFDGWIPAKTENTKEEQSSITIFVTIKNGRLTATKKQISFNTKTDLPKESTIATFPSKKITGTYKNYKFTTWNNESLDENHAISSYVSIDKLNNLWFMLGDSLIKFNGSSFESTKLNTEINPKVKKLYGVLTDNSDAKWFVAFKENWKVAILSQNESGWIDHTVKLPLINYFYDFYFAPKSNKIILTRDKGLLIWQSQKWSKINYLDIKSSPEDEFYFAREDNSGRLWIGAEKGTYLISSNGVVTNFNSFNNPLKDMTITAFTEDKFGNVFLGYKEVYKKSVSEKKLNRGIAVYNNLNEWKTLKVNESDFVGKNIKSLSYNEQENILWIAITDLGIVRYDLSNNKSEDFSPGFFDMTAAPNILRTLIDQKNNLYLIMDHGITKIEKLAN
jgi:hypothetical protein